MNSENKLSAFEEGILAHLSPDEFKKLRSLNLAIIGAGGLGSNCACFLVRSGFKNLLIIDGDRVEKSNLNRQFFFENQLGLYKVDALKENLLAFNKNLNIKTLKVMLNKNHLAHTFKGIDIIIEAVDKAEDKAMLAAFFLSENNKLYIGASGIASWKHPDKIRVKEVKPSFFIVGDFIDEAEEEKRVFCPKVAVLAAKQADIAFQYALGRWKYEKKY